MKEFRFVQRDPNRPICDPVRQPDVARLLAVLGTPGVVNGTVEFDTQEGGKEVVDFEKRESGMPTIRTYTPKECSDKLEK